MATCDELATQLSGLQSQLSEQQNQLSGLQSQLSDLQYQRTHPNEACADQGLTGTDCQLYLKGLGPQIDAAKAQIASVQAQVASVQVQIASVQQKQQTYWCFPIYGVDGVQLTITTDDQGNITVAEAVGTDGVRRTFIRTSSFNQNKQGWYYTVLRQEFFENGQRYLYMTTWIYLWGRKVSVSMSGGGKDYGLSINFPDDGSHDSTPITIVSGAMGQQFATTTGTLNLNQGSISSPSFTADFALPPEIAQQVNKILYFQQLFDRENEQTAAQAASDFQASGIDPNTTTLNQALYGQAAMILHPLGRGGRGTSSQADCRIVGVVAGIAAGLIVNGGLLLLDIPAPVARIAGTSVAGVVGVYAGQLCVDYQNNKFPQGDPPPPSDMGAMPPDASVPMDDGDQMSDGGDGSGGPSGVCLPPGSGESVIVPFEETIADCL